MAPFPTSTSDDALVGRALAGSDRAWRKLHGAYERRVYNYALRMVGNAEDARDLTQDIFLGVLRNLPQYRREGAFAGWLFRIASYRCTDHLRRRRFLERYDDSEVAGSTDPQLELLMTHANRQIVDALSRLPVPQRQVVELKFFQHLTFEEIAGALDISPNTAKTRLYTALKKLKHQEELRDAL